MGQKLDKGEHWSNSAKCAKIPLEKIDEIFFVERGGSVKRARNICNSCPVQRLCLLEAVNFDLDGFWSGTTRSERRQMRGFNSLGSPSTVVESHVGVVPRPRLYRKSKVKSAVPLENAEPTIEELEEIEHELDLDSSLVGV